MFRVVGWGFITFPWERRRKERAMREAFEQLRRVDAEWCESMGYIDCCDAHPSG